MKKFIKYIAVLLPVVAITASCSMFKLDNFDGPNAQIHGKIIDPVTNEPVGIEATYSSELDIATLFASGFTIWNYVTVSKGALVVNELGWKDRSGNEVYEDQRWYVRFDGSYRNDLIFAAKYKAYMKELPCYEPDTTPEFEVSRGMNTLDIKAVPFCRIKSADGSSNEPEITYDATNDRLVARFSVELSDPTKANSILNLKLCASKQLYVGANYFNMVNYDGTTGDAGSHKDGGSYFGMVFPAATPGTPVELTLNCSKTGPNAELFEYKGKQDIYVRIAAQAGGNNFNGENLYNFSKVYKVSKDMKVTPVVWDEI